MAAEQPSVTPAPDKEFDVWAVPDPQHAQEVARAVEVAPETHSAETPAPIGGVLVGRTGTGPDDHVPTFDEVRARLAPREAEAFRRQRENYLAFSERIGEATLDNPVGGHELRSYVLRQLVELTGHPDGKIAARALELLGKTTPVGLFGHTKPPSPPGARKLQDLVDKVTEVTAKPKGPAK